MDEPTEKQINYAGTIARTLHIDLPKEFTKQAYWEFINKRKSQFDSALHSHHTPIFTEDDPWSPESVYDASWFC